MLLTCASLTSCGSSKAPSPLAVRVGDAVITEADVAHRMSVISIGRTSQVDAPGAGSLREQALKYLISAQWTIQEAPSEHRPLSRAEIERRLTEREHSLFPGGTTERDEFLKQTGERPSDLKLEVELELALEKLHKGVSQGIYPATDSDAAAYYREHRSQFGLPELREVWIIDRKSYAAAAGVKHRAQSGVRFGSFARTEVATGPHGTGGHPPEGPLEIAIDAAKPHTLVGPIKYRADYLVFELKRLVPPRYRPLTSVISSIKETITKQRERVTLKRLVREWRLRWQGMTECEPAFMVQKCRGFSGTRVREDPLVIQ